MSVSRFLGPWDRPDGERKTSFDAFQTFWHDSANAGTMDDWLCGRCDAEGFFEAASPTC